MDVQRPRTPPISYDASPSDSNLEHDPTRLSSDSARFDYNWLQDEQEQEELLANNKPGTSNIFGRRRAGQDQLGTRQTQPWTVERAHRTTARRRNGKREIIHKIEEGGSRGETPPSDSSDGSSEVDREKIGVVLARGKVCYSTSRHWHRLHLTHGRYPGRDGYADMRPFMPSSPSASWSLRMAPILPLNALDNRQPPETCSRMGPHNLRPPPSSSLSMGSVLTTSIAGFHRHSQRSLDRGFRLSS